MTGRDTQYLTLITMPDGVGRKDLARALHESAGLDAKTIELSLGRTPPCIIGLHDPRQCQAAVRRIVELGGDAFACDLGEIQALGGTRKIKDLRLEGGTLVGDLWRGGAFRIEPADILILIRVKLSQTQTKPPPPAAMRGVGGMNVGRPAALGFGMGGAYGASMMLYAHHDTASFAWDRTIKTSDKLDIHLAGGGIYQIDGDKFGFRILGNQRGLSDHVNIDKMCELLAMLAPEAVVDPYFSLWSPPIGHQRLRIPDAKINRDDPAFAFYSRWAALMYRHVMGLR